MRSHRYNGHYQYTPPPHARQVERATAKTPTNVRTRGDRLIGGNVWLTDFRPTVVVAHNLRTLRRGRCRSALGLSP
ncbi:Uncharacterized protein HSR122_1302 [Halapricum desulfuricans]|uniref:Uncharacterized protein n=1 Tax=Halapricum desulfuricans TaxID=2841257 RepID=A0A897NCJ3_9EURY|nr:Uncharacterized protein HSR122_1302 [Halapricum desulfuricans]